MVVRVSSHVETGDCNIHATGNAAEYAYGIPVNFKTSDWKVSLVRIVVRASQNYRPFLVGESILKTKVTYAGKGSEIELRWGNLDYDQNKNGTTSMIVSGKVSGQEVKISLIYSVPFPGAILVAICSFTVETYVYYESIPTDTVPTPPDTQLPESNVTKDGDDPPGFDFFGLHIKPEYILLGAGILTVLLIARPSAPISIIKEAIRK